MTFLGSTRLEAHRPLSAFIRDPVSGGEGGGAIETRDVRRAVSGGRKSDHVRHRGDEEVVGGSAEVRARIVGSQTPSR